MVFACAPSLVPLNKESSRRLISKMSKRRKNPLQAPRRYVIVLFVLQIKRMIKTVFK